LLQISLQSTASETDARIDDEEYVQLTKYLSHDPVGVDELVSNSGLTIEQVSSMLLILELEGVVEPLSGGRYSLLR
jgi:DNA processing protein